MSNSRPWFGKESVMDSVVVNTVSKPAGFRTKCLIRLMSAKGCLDALQWKQRHICERCQSQIESRSFHLQSRYCKWKLEKIEDKLTRCRSSSCLHGLKTASTIDLSSLQLSVAIEKIGDNMQLVRPPSLKSATPNSDRPLRPRCR